MLWTNILLAYDNSQASLRAVEYVGQMFSQVEGARVILYSVYDKPPEYDMVETPFTNQVKGRIQALHREKEEGRLRLEEAKRHLVKLGFSEDQVSLEYVEKKKSVAKQIVDKARQEQCGTVVIGRQGDVRSLVFGSVAESVIGSISGATVCVVE
jgi:nucleotide-binding universal stress UspA family protein